MIQTVQHKHVALCLLPLLASCESTADLGGTCNCEAGCPEAAIEAGADAPQDTADAQLDTAGDQDTSTDAPSEAPEDAPVTRRYVFVTRATYVGNFGGISEGDFRCQTSAAAAGLDGTFKAWLSDEVTDAADRFVMEGPRYEVESEKVIFANLAGLRGYPLSPTRNDELSEEAPDRWWTGTLSNGIKSSDHCLNWSSDSQFQGGMTGQRLSPIAPPGPEWTQDDVYACLGEFALLCIQD